MTELRAVNGVGESERNAPTFTHPQIPQIQVTSKNPDSYRGDWEVSLTKCTPTPFKYLA